MRRRDILQAVTVFAVVLVILLGYGYVQSEVDQAQRDITCVSALSNIEQLTALTEIADRLGIPHDFTVPKVPAECD